MTSVMPLGDYTSLAADHVIPDPELFLEACLTARYRRP